MDRARSDKTERLTVTTYGADLRALRRVASLMPGFTPHGAALRALRLGLPLVEEELREAAGKLNTGTDGLDAEGL